MSWIDPEKLAAKMREAYPNLDDSGRGGRVDVGLRLAIVSYVARRPGVTRFEIACQFGVLPRGKKNAREGAVGEKIAPMLKHGILNDVKLPRFVPGNVHAVVHEHTGHLIVGEAVLREGYPEEMRRLPFEVDGAGRVIGPGGRRRGRRKMRRAQLRKLVRERERDEAIENQERLSRAARGKGQA